MEESSRTIVKNRPSFISMKTKRQYFLNCFPSMWMRLKKHQKIILTKSEKTETEKIPACRTSRAWKKGSGISRLRSRNTSHGNFFRRKIIFCRKVVRSLQPSRSQTLPNKCSRAECSVLHKTYQIEHFVDRNRSLTGISWFREISERVKMRTRKLFFWKKERGVWMKQLSISFTLESV